MNISQEEALSLLGKWMAEGHIIHATIGSGGVVGKVLGKYRYDREWCCSHLRSQIQLSSRRQELR